MDRRKFFGTMVGGVAVAAAVRTWPFRIYSFPTEIERLPTIRNFFYANDKTRRLFYADVPEGYELFLAT